MKYFFHEDYIFHLTTPEYEAAVFGYKIGELRSISSKSINLEKTEIVSICHFEKYIIENEIKICTYRGEEKIGIIRLLMELGFLFVGTFSEVSCKKEEFNDLSYKKDFDFSIAGPDEYNEILKLEATVFDYSTFQIDPLVDLEIAFKRNKRRVKSYFNRSGHVIYVVRINEKIAGFLQFVIDPKENYADCVNGGIHPDFQKVSLGVVLYSKSFSKVFDTGIQLIKSGFGVQNIAMSKIFSLFNFKLDSQEIHLRKFI
jgi:hypothetical protein